MSSVARARSTRTEQPDVQHSQFSPDGAALTVVARLESTDPAPDTAALQVKPSRNLTPPKHAKSPTQRPVRTRTRVRRRRACTEARVRVERRDANRPPVAPRALQAREEGPPVRSSPVSDEAVDLPGLFDLTGRVAIVTGASSGLGDRFARVLHAAGAVVAVAARRADRLDALVEELGERAVAYRCDVTDPVATTAMVDSLVGAHGRIDVLVNNAGYGVPAPAVEETLDSFRYTLEVNLTGLFALSQAVARPMLEAEKGSIVNIASIFGLVGSAPTKESSYCAAKGAVVNLTRALGCEWGRRGVRVNAIAPGWFPTEMTQAEMFDDPAGAAHIARNTPMGRAGRLAELDGALLYLASDASTYTTGHVLTVDGGWTAR